MLSIEKRYYKNKINLYNILINIFKEIFMKNKKIYLIILLFSIFLQFFYKNGYKNIFPGNNIINKSTEEIVDSIIKKCNKYEANLSLTVKSNKTEKNYELYQKVATEEKYMKVISTGRNEGIEFIEKINKIEIKNNKLNLSRQLEIAKTINSNNLYLNTFLEEYTYIENKIITENDNYYIVELDLKKLDSILAKKIMYINKEGNIEKLEGYDNNNNKVIYILYKDIKFE